MRFLLEKVLLEAPNDNEFSQQDFFRFNSSTKAERDKFAYNYLRKLPNYKYLKRNLVNYIKIMTAGGLKQPFLNYIKWIPQDMDNSIPDLVYQLTKLGKLIPGEKEYNWLTNESLYTEDTEDIINKIKILTLVTNPEFKEKYKDNPEFKLRTFIDKKGNIISSNEMNAIIDKWEKEQQFTSKDSKEKQDTEKKEKEDTEKKEKEPKDFEFKKVTDIETKRSLYNNLDDIKREIDNDNLSIKNLTNIINDTIDSSRFEIQEFLTKFLGDDMSTTFYNFFKSDNGYETIKSDIEKPLPIINSKDIYKAILNVQDRYSR